MLTIGTEYVIGHSDPWDWIDGTRHWWVISALISGYNGAGGYWIIERWRWDNGSEVRENIRSLSYKESRDLESAAAKFLPEVVPPTEGEDLPKTPTE